jgi:hypothetical protein
MGGTTLPPMIGLYKWLRSLLQSAAFYLVKGFPDLTPRLLDVKRRRPDYPLGGVIIFRYPRSRSAR